MKTIFFSDLHGNINVLEQLINHEKPDKLYCCGDLELDDNIIDKYKIITVKGNCDYNNTPIELLIELDEKRVFLTHGHKYDVKYSLNSLLYKGLELECNVIIFGHTHRKYNYSDDKLKIMNPGSLQDLSYIVYENGEFEFRSL